MPQRITERESSGSPAWIRTTIHGSKGRCPTIRRPGNCELRNFIQCSVRPTPTAISTYVSKIGSASNSDAGTGSTGNPARCHDRRPPRITATEIPRVCRRYATRALVASLSQVQ